MSPKFYPHPKYWLWVSTDIQWLCVIFFILMIGGASIFFSVGLLHFVMILSSFLWHFCVTFCAESFQNIGGFLGPPAPLPGPSLAQGMAKFKPSPWFIMAFENDKSNSSSNGMPLCHAITHWVRAFMTYKSFTYRTFFHGTFPLLAFPLLILFFFWPSITPVLQSTKMTVVTIEDGLWPYTLE